MPWARLRLALAAVAVLAVGACSADVAPTPGQPSATATLHSAPTSPLPPDSTSPPASGRMPTTLPPSASPPELQGALAFAGPERLIPADGQASALIEATVVDGSGAPFGRQQVELRALGDDDDGALIIERHARLDPSGRVTFAISHVRPGRHAFALYASAAPEQQLATIEVEFTRKVVVLAPGFFSTLASRFEIFGPPTVCRDPAAPLSIREALICLGYTSDGEDAPLDGPAATIVDMAWEVAGCRPADEAAEPPRRDCVATIVATRDGEVAWRPADYDLSDLALSILRQQQIDLWAHRLAETMVTYDRELHAATGQRASFYLLGHSMGGQVVVRVLRALLDEPQLAVHFEGDGRGLLQRIVSVDGALNWTGTVDLVERSDCGMPAVTVADERRERDNVDAVERGHDRFGVTTVAMTSATDPIVGPAVALLRDPAEPDRGYVDEVFHEDQAGSAACTHSALLWPEPTGYPLNDVLVEHIGPAAGP